MNIPYDCIVHKSYLLAHKPFDQTIPVDSIDVRINRQKRRIVKYLEKYKNAKQKHNKNKMELYGRLIIPKKGLLKYYNELKRMQLYDIFERQDKKKQNNILY